MCAAAHSDNMTQAPSRPTSTATGSQVRTAKELDETVDLAIDTFARCFNDVFPRIVDELFAEAERETDRLRQSRILDAYGLVRSNRERIEQEFRSSIATIVRDRIAAGPQKSTDYASKTVNIDKLSLVDDSEIEADLIIRRLVSQLRKTGGSGTEDEQRNLDTRLGYLLGKDQIEDKENPFSADALARAIQNAFRELATEQEVQLEILRTFESFASEAFNPAYQKINTHLVDRRVIPDINAYRRQRMQVGRNDWNPTATVPGAGTATTPRPDQTQPRNHENLLERFTRFRATQPSDVTSTLPSQGTPDTFWPVISRSVMDYLPSLVPDAPPPTDTELVAVPLVQLNMLHQVRDNARRLGAPRDEEILIDLVAVLVDKILQDRQVPERIKRLISRLQVPLLRAALLDKNLFATKEHPARVLLDTIARSAVGWTEEKDAGGRYYELIFEIVSAVETQFKDDVSVFSAQTAKLDAFIEEEARREAAEYERAAAVLQQVEQREVADVQALEQIRAAVADIELPPELTEFLLDPWRCVLVDAAVQNVAPDIIDGYRRALTDLVWSVQPKVSPEERQALVRMLPDLLKRVRAGLLLIALPVADQEAFFAQLMQLHSSAVKVGVRSQMQDIAFRNFESRVEKLHIDPQAEPKTPIQITPETLIASVKAAPVPVAVAGEHTPAPRQRLSRPARMTREYIDTMMQAMNKGVWVEVVDGAQVVQMRLRWVSPHRSMYLFTDRQGKEALTYTPELLRVQIADGLLALLDTKDLSDRVIDSLEESIGALV